MIYFTWFAGLGCGSRNATLEICVRYTTRVLGGEGHNFTKYRFAVSLGDIIRGADIDEGGRA